MCRKESDTVKNLFRYPALVLTGVVLFVCTFLGGAVLVAQNGAAALQYSSNSNSLNALPVNEKNNSAAVRWNNRYRTAMPVRLENRTPQTGVNYAGQPNEDLLTGYYPAEYIAQQYTAYSKEADFICYRRLWQKILPTRAGPST